MQCNGVSKEMGLSVGIRESRLKAHIGISSYLCKGISRLLLARH